MLENTVAVSGRKSRLVYHICRDMPDAVRVARAMVAEGFKGVRIAGVDFSDT